MDRTQGRGEHAFQPSSKEPGNQAAQSSPPVAWQGSQYATSPPADGGGAPQAAAEASLPAGSGGAPAQAPTGSPPVKTLRLDGTEFPGWPQDLSAFRYKIPDIDPWANQAVLKEQYQSLVDAAEAMDGLLGEPLKYKKAVQDEYEALRKLHVHVCTARDSLRRADYGGQTIAISGDANNQEVIQGKISQ